MLQKAFLYSLISLLLENLCFNSSESFLSFFNFFLLNFASNFVSGFNVCFGVVFSFVSGVVFGVSGFNRSWGEVDGGLGGRVKNYHIE